LAELLIHDPHIAGELLAELATAEMDVHHGRFELPVAGGPLD